MAVVMQMRKRPFLQNKQAYYKAGMIGSFLFLFWYGISLLIASHLMRHNVQEGQWINLLQADYLALFRIARSLMDVQYLVKVGLHEIVHTFFLIIKGFSVVEIGYLLFWLVLVGLLTLKQTSVKFIKSVFFFHAAYVLFVLLVGVYYALLAWKVFYRVNMAYTVALTQAANVTLLSGILILLLASFAAFYIFLQSRRGG